MNYNYLTGLELIKLLARNPQLLYPVQQSQFFTLPVMPSISFIPTSLPTAPVIPSIPFIPPSLPTAPLVPVAASQLQLQPQPQPQPQPQLQLRPQPQPQSQAQSQLQPQPQPQSQLQPQASSIYIPEAEVKEEEEDIYLPDTRKVSLKRSYDTYSDEKELGRSVKARHDTYCVPCKSYTHDTSECLLSYPCRICSGYSKKCAYNHITRNCKHLCRICRDLIIVNPHSLHDNFEHRKYQH